MHSLLTFFLLFEELDGLKQGTAIAMCPVILRQQECLATSPSAFIGPEHSVFGLITFDRRDKMPLYFVEIIDYKNTKKKSRVHIFFCIDNNNFSPFH